MNDKPVLFSATEASGRIRAGELSARDYVRACLDRIDQWDGSINAWSHINSSLALQQAESVDERLRTGEGVGVLAGIPIGVKDIFNTRDLPTQMGSPIWKDFQPGNDARVVHSCRMAGGVVLGKTVTAEFAVHTPGPTKNPHNPEYMPGTSSSGSAAAVAAYMTPLALGTQTAGSTIRPASYCGIYGFKPSFGLIPRTGMLKTTDSLDTVGFFARNVDDLSLMFEAIRVHGPDYPISNAAFSDPARRTKGDRPWRVAVVRGPKWDCAEKYAQKSLLRYADQLSQLDDIVVDYRDLPPSFSEAHEVHSIIYDRTLAYYFKEEFKERTLISGIMYEIIERGNGISLDQYKNALDRQNQLARELDYLLCDHCDVVLGLSTGGEPLRGLDSVDRPDACLVWTLCGVPAISLPVFAGPHGLPFGAQVVSRRFNDYLLLEFVRFLEGHDLAPIGTHPIPPCL